MKTYSLKLESKMSSSFRAMRAANSLDIDIVKKSIHEFSVDADLESHFNVGLIVGASGSGKSTLARHVYGAECMRTYLKPDVAVIDQFPEDMNYDDCANVLTGIGLSSVPCWLKPSGTLSNGQQARAEAALSLVYSTGVGVIDEWTSVVDRTVAKVMSHCVQKFARRMQRQIVLVSCHYDVIEWLNPDWLIDCNSQRFIDRRSLHPDERRRGEKLSFTVREVTANSWARFSKYHYLSADRVGGRVLHFGLFLGANMIGYGCLVNYVPWSDKSKPMIMHVSRVVIHPDYAGLGLGIRLFNAIAAYGAHRLRYRVLTKFSSTPVYRSMIRDKSWRHIKTDRQIGRTKTGDIRGQFNVSGKPVSGFRENVKTHTFEFIGDSDL